MTWFHTIFNSPTLFPSFARKMQPKSNDVTRIQRRIESLESRLVMSSVPVTGQPVVPLPASALDDVSPAMVFGDPDGDPPDAVVDHVDANSVFSEFSGVVSLSFANEQGGFLCSGTAISTRHVLTAAHCADTTGNGVPDFAPEEVTVVLNFNRQFVTRDAVNIHSHPDFHGFQESINDDLLIVELSTPLPEVVDTYSIRSTPFQFVERFTQVGYGRTGDGVNGFTGPADFFVKHSGENQAEAVRFDDEGTGSVEMFFYDFDGPDASTNRIGPNIEFFLTLGNDVEAAGGPGDSGGPVFMDGPNGERELFAVYTLTWGNRPFFGSGGGGVVLSPYVEWIDSVIGDTTLRRPGRQVGQSQTEPGQSADLVAPPLDDDDMGAAPGIATALLQPGNARGDLQLGFADFLRLSSNYGKTDAVWADGDFSEDGVVDFADFLRLSSNYGKTDAVWADGDFSEDGVVDFADLLILVERFAKPS